MAKEQFWVGKVKKCKIGPGLSIKDKPEINVEELILGKKISIGKSVKISGGRIVIQDDTKISDNVTINVTKNFVLGPRSVLGKSFKIEGRDIVIGAELWSDENCTIGGGSCYEIHSSLRIGYWCHLGAYVFINTARPVTIGNEVGLGTRTSLYTHGAYQSVLDGYPVEFEGITIKDNCWLPGAIVNPGVTIGPCTVVGVGSIVTKSLPGSCLAAGIPARVIKENIYPRKLSLTEVTDIMKAILKSLGEILTEQYNTKVRENAKGYTIELPGAIIIYNEKSIKGGPENKRTILIGPKCGICGDENTTVFDLKNKCVTGHADGLSERVRNQLRRYGIRFKVKDDNHRYVPW